MKRSVLAGFCLAVSLALAPGAALIPEISVYAVTTAVSGTITSDSTADILCLDTGAGVMKIKLDSNTDLSESGVLIAGAKVSADVYRGSDAYMHAAKITAPKQTPVTVDTANTVTVDGTVQSGTTASLLLLSTTSGEMKIKIDGSTDLAGAGVIVTGRRLSVTVARGSDSYMHALKITSYVAPSSSVQVTSALTATDTLTGTIKDGTSQGSILLSTSSGDKTITILSNTDLSAGRILTPGGKVSVDVYTGTDGKLYAVKVVGVLDGLDVSSTADVSGTVASGTEPSLLLLSTGAGTMKIRIDSTTDMSGAGILTLGKTVNAKVCRGSDAYMHALRITDPSLKTSSGTQSSSSASSSSSSQVQASSSVISASGTPEERSDDNTMYLSTSGGTMIIKLDSGTKMETKAYMPGHTVNVTLYHGTDGYLHAQTVSDTTWKSGDAVASTANPIEIQGTVASGSALNQLNFTGSDGTNYKIRLDNNTSVSVRAIKPGKQLKISFGTSTDGYLHAISVRDPAAVTTVQEGSSKYISVTGTPESRSDDDTMYLSTSGGTMIIKLDSGTKMNSKTYVPGRSVRVSVYHGNDGYLHAESVTDESWSGASASWNDTRIQVNGTVSSGTDVNLLQLRGSDGSAYRIKIDSGTQSFIRALKEGRSLTVTVAGSGDGYLHAVEIR